ncbi:MAG TPA: hypothetical protein VK558_09520 [Patescibacteria group bacterium]|nr:hypothetical protein [Patescibacteria group bacterium]
MTGQNCSVIAEIATERRRQTEAEGHVATHDDNHPGEMAQAGGLYAYNAGCARTACVVDTSDSGSHIVHIWPWEDSSFKPKTVRRDLIRAAALIVAEIESIDRMALALEEIKAARQAAEPGKCPSCIGSPGYALEWPCKDCNGSGKEIHHG